MQNVKSIFGRSLILVLFFALVCGVIYTFSVFGISQLFFRDKANGSLIIENGEVVGSSLIGQPFSGDAYLQGRAENADVTTYKDASGNALYYAKPSELSPDSQATSQDIHQAALSEQKENPDESDQAVPEDLVTQSGSGLDPDISPQAAEYQVARIAKARGISEETVEKIIAENTSGKFLGIFGSDRVNVLGVNLALDSLAKSNA